MPRASCATARRCSATIRRKSRLRRNAGSRPHHEPKTGGRAARKPRPTATQDGGIVTAPTTSTPAPSERIGLSIVIPTFGRCQRLERLLAELELQLAGEAGADVGGIL